MLALLNTVQYLGASLVALGVFTWLYMWATPIDELKLLRAGNTAAGYTLGGAILGYVLPLYTVVTHAAAWGEFLFWAAFSLVVQVALSFALRLFMKDAWTQIESDARGTAVFFAALSLAVGAMNAAAIV